MGEEGVGDELSIAFDNSYARLPEAFFARQAPVPVSRPELLRFNHRLATELGLDAAALASAEGAAVLAGNVVPDGAEPVAMAYAGHQFAHWVPRLGDGRAVLLGEFVAADGERRDVHLKGAGRTAFSRGGDGRSALGPVIREYLVSEAMAGLGIPTTRSLAMVGTGDTVLRQWGPEPGGVLTRIARSHVRVGTFQYFLGSGDEAAIRTLTDYVIARHYPALRGHASPALALLQSVCEATADLIAQWQLVGFIHGVMNTDNVSIAGETLDFGPCAFLDAYHPDKVFSSIDRGGRYAWSRQPLIGAWNMARFAETLLPLIDADPERAVARAQEVLGGYSDRIETRLAAGWAAKLGLGGAARAGDEALAAALLSAMADNGADFTRTFRALCEVDPAAPGEADEAVRREFTDPAAFDEWAIGWRARLADAGAVDRRAWRAAMRAVNPAYIPRNHRVEQAIRAVYDDGDLTLVDALLEVLVRPFDDHPGCEWLTEAPSPAEEVRQTFCGT